MIPVCKEKIRQIGTSKIYSIYLISLNFYVLILDFIYLFSVLKSIFTKIVIKSLNLHEVKHYGLLKE